MQIAAVLALDRIIVIGIVVELANLVAAVEHRHAAERQQEGMEHLDLGKRLLPVLLRAAEGGRRAAQARIAQTRIVVVQLAAGGRTLPLARQIVVEIALMRHLALAELREIIVVQAQPMSSWQRR